MKFHLGALHEVLFRGALQRSFMGLHKTLFGVLHKGSLKVFSFEAPQGCLMQFHLQDASLGHYRVIQNAPFRPASLESS